MPTISVSVVSLEFLGTVATFTKFIPQKERAAERRKDQEPM